MLNYTTTAPGDSYTPGGTPHGGGGGGTDIPPVIPPAPPIVPTPVLPPKVTTPVSSGSLNVTASNVTQYGALVTMNNTVGAGIATISVNGKPASLTSGDPLNLVSGKNVFGVSLPNGTGSYTITITTNNGYQGTVKFTSSPQSVLPPEITGDVTVLGITLPLIAWVGIGGLGLYLLTRR